MHFHEDPLGLFADIKVNGVDFERFEVNTALQRALAGQAAKEAVLKGPNLGAKPSKPGSRYK